MIKENSISKKVIFRVSIKFKMLGFFFFHFKRKKLEEIVSINSFRQQKCD